MGRIVGIDLGTTYSAVTIPEDRSGQDGFLTVRACLGCSVILDDLKRHITPSVVAEDERSETLVGYSAKARAGLSPAPIMFAKRSMGEDTSFVLGQRGALRPEEVSAEILKYLKRLAEKRLGEPVDEVVVTVPAYFSLKAREMTGKAAELAGMRVAQIALEPVAAALMYSMGDSRESLRVLTYDLGGGTFDVAILEKRDGVISNASVKAFDGDRFLGGYNFDVLLANWLVEQLGARGYDLRLNHNDPADRVIFAKLMIYAEQAKIALSKADTYEFQEPATGIIDHAGRPVALGYLNLTRAEFEGMISQYVDYSLDLCERALEKAFPDQDPAARRAMLDEILMVGGSSRIPMVAQRLETHFGRKPKLIDPDLCVALGAGIIAGTKAQTIGCLKLDPILAETELPELTVTGQVVPGGSLTSVERCTVTLRALDQSYLRTRPVGEGGRFAFTQIPLALDSQTDFALSVTAPGAGEVASHRFSVRQTAEVKTPPPPPVANVLPKPICVLLKEGPYVVAPERTVLPYEKLVRAKTTDTSGVIRIEIREEHTPLGEILMAGIPETLPVGSAVEITVTIQENFQIRARGYVPALARQESVVVDIVVPSPKTIKELRRAFEILQEKAEEALAMAGRGVAFAKAARLRQRMNYCAEMLKSAESGGPAEPGAIQDCLNEIETLIREIKPWQPKPARAAFEEKVHEAQDLLAEAIKQKPRVEREGYDKQIEAIQAEAEKAYREQNSAVWKDAYDKLADLCQRLESLTGGGGGGEQSPAQLIMTLAQQLEQLERWARANGVYERHRRDFDELLEALKRIDPNSPRAMAEIQDWYFVKFQGLKQRLEAPETIGLLDLDRSRGGGA